MNEVLSHITAGVVANAYLGTEIALRLVDVLVVKNVLTKDEAADTLEAIVEGVRRDAANDTTTHEMIEATASTLQEAASSYRQ